MRALDFAPCAACGARVELERAARVRLIGSRQYAFCSDAHAREFDPARVTAKPPAASSLPEPARPFPEARASESTTVPYALGAPFGDLVEAPSPEATFEREEEAASPEESPESRPPEEQAPERRTPTLGKHFWLVFAACFVGLFASGVRFAESGRWTAFTPALSLVLAVVVERFILARRPVRTSLAPRLVERLLSTRAKKAASAPRSTRHPSTTTNVGAGDLRSGEEFVWSAGELAPADGSVLEGRGHAVLLGGRGEKIPLERGDGFIAGMRLVEGEVRALAERTGPKRALERHLAALRNPPAHFFAIGWPRFTLEFVAAAVVGLLVLANLAVEKDWVSALLLTSHLAVVATSELRRRAELESFEGLIDEFATAGVFLSGASSLATLATVTTAVLSTRGTLLRGSPEVARIESFDERSELDLLRLAGGAELLVVHPLADALTRELERRGQAPLAARNPQYFPGQGVVCTTDEGATLVVGSRELLLTAHVSLASHEARLSSLERTGYSTLLVAERRRLVGVIAFIDTLHRDSTALVQNLLESDIDPILVSGDSKETTLALAERLGVEHVRPETPAHERPQLVRRLRESGLTVAVVGRGGLDDETLDAGDIGLSLGGRGNDKHARVLLLGGSPLAAAVALTRTRHAFARSQLFATLSLVPPGLLALGATFGLVGSASLAPLGLAATLAALPAAERWLRGSRPLPTRMKPPSGA